MKLPKRIFKRPSPETMARIEAEAEAASKGLPSRHPDCPPGIQELLDDLIHEIFEGAPEAPEMTQSLRDAVEETFMHVVFARHRGQSLDGHLFERLTEELPAGLDESVRQFSYPPLERTIRACWRTLAEAEAEAESHKG